MKCFWTRPHVDSEEWFVLAPVPTHLIWLASLAWTRLLSWQGQLKPVCPSIRWAPAKSPLTRHGSSSFVHTNRFSHTTSSQIHSCGWACLGLPGLSIIGKVRTSPTFHLFQHIKTLSAAESNFNLVCWSSNHIGSFASGWQPLSSLTWTQISSQIFQKCLASEITCFA